MELSSKKVIMIIAPENFRDEEYFHTREALEKKGVDVDVASTQKVAVSGIDKEEVTVDVLLDSVEDHYDALVFVGGGGAKVYFDNQKALSLARTYHEKGKIVAAICIAPLILGHAGLLQDKKATCWDGVHDDLSGFGARFTGKKVTIDGTIITGNGPKAAHKFGKTIAKAL
ncbi:DJ-1 family protein [Candidatus Peregrinibacteria bacterium]|nr:DJ-1 family protein [Candidatus Peregrinibacteria bacterium]